MSDFKIYIHRAIQKLSKGDKFVLGFTPTNVQDDEEINDLMELRYEVEYSGDMEFVSVEDLMDGIFCVWKKK